MTSRFYTIKDEVRILGVDDGPHERGAGGEALIVGTVFRGGSFLDGVVSTSVKVDGLDATEKLVKLIKASKFKDLRVVMLDGLAFAGFNLVDINHLAEETGLAVIVVVRKQPDFKEIRKALKHLKDFEGRWRLIEEAGELHAVGTRPGKKIFIQLAGIKLADAREIVKLASTRSLIPEPIRVAHLIAQGIVLGESRGKA